MAMTDTLEHVTTSVARRVREGHEADFVEWTDRGIDLVRTFPGFLGGGWLRSSAESSDYHVVYRFETHDHLEAWLRSEARRDWLGRGRPIADDVVTHRLSGVEGWFEPQSNLTDAVRERLDASGRPRDGVRMITSVTVIAGEDDAAAAVTGAVADPALTSDA